MRQIIEAKKPPRTTPFLSTSEVINFFEQWGFTRIVMIDSTDYGTYILYLIYWPGAGWHVGTSSGYVDWSMNFTDESEKLAMLMFKINTLEQKLQTITKDLGGKIRDLRAEYLTLKGTNEV